jgi:hypothetical protein
VDDPLIACVVCKYDDWAVLTGYYARLFVVIANDTGATLIKNRNGPGGANCLLVTLFPDRNALYKLLNPPDLPA